MLILNSIVNECAALILAWIIFIKSVKIRPKINPTLNESGDCFHVGSHENSHLVRPRWVSRIQQQPEGLLQTVRPEGTHRGGPSGHPGRFCFAKAPKVGAPSGPLVGFALRAKPCARGIPSGFPSHNGRPSAGLCVAKPLRGFATRIRRCPEGATHRVAEGHPLCEQCPEGALRAWVSRRDTLYVAPLGATCKGPHEVGPHVGALRSKAPLRILRSKMRGVARRATPVRAAALRAAALCEGLHILVHHIWCNKSPSSLRPLRGIPRIFSDFENILMTKMSCSHSKCISRNWFWLSKIHKISRIIFKNPYPPSWFLIGLILVQNEKQDYFWEITTKFRLVMVNTTKIGLFCASYTVFSIGNIF